MQLAQIAQRGAVARPNLPQRAFVRPARLLASPARAYVPYSPHDTADEEVDALANARPPTRDEQLHRDFLTHSVAGEHDFAVFFLVAMGAFMLPVMFPGAVLIFAWLHEQFPTLWGGML